MNDFSNFVLSAWTVFVAVIYAAIVLWSWSRRRQSEFDLAARIPLDDE